MIALGASALIEPLTSFAQQSTTNVVSIGFLSAAPLSSITARTAAFRQGLRDLTAGRRKWVSSIFEIFGARPVNRP